MPELPELEAVRDVLKRRVVGETIAQVEVVPPGGPVVVRDLTHAGFESGLAGSTIEAVARRGKFLIFSFRSDPPGLSLAVNPKLTGRLQLAAPSARRLAKT